MPWRSAIGKTIPGMIYMLHWIPVIACVTLRMCIVPKKLKWVKTQHQGAGKDIFQEFEEAELQTGQS
jgi:1,2-diacylglycerol 3-beta-glucosyltransferase